MTHLGTTISTSARRPGAAREVAAGQLRGARAMHRPQRGFTIVELIITLVIAAILVALAAPNMAIFLKNSARTTMLNDLVTAVQYARSQAITLNRDVSICPVDLRDGQFNAADAEDACRNDGVFETGWVVFDAPDRNGQIGVGETVRRIFATTPAAGATFRGLDADDAALRFVVYRNTGLADVTQLPSQPHFKYCDDRENPNQSARAVILTGSGQPRISQDSNDSGVHNISLAEDLSCL